MSSVGHYNLKVLLGEFQEVTYPKVSPHPHHPHLMNHLMKPLPHPPHLKILSQ